MLLDRGSPSSGKAMSRRIVVGVRGPGRSDPQAGADVAQPAEASGLGRGALEPGPADVAEHHRAEPEEVEELALSRTSAARSSAGRGDRPPGSAADSRAGRCRRREAAGRSASRRLRQVDAGGDVERLVRRSRGRDSAGRARSRSGPPPPASSRPPNAAERVTIWRSVGLPGADRALTRRRRRPGRSRNSPRRIPAWPNPASRSQVLGTVDAVEVVLDDEAVLDPAPAHPGIDELAVGRQRGRRLLRDLREAGLVVGDAEPQPVSLAAREAAGEADPELALAARFLEALAHVARARRGP